MHHDDGSHGEDVDGVGDVDVGGDGGHGEDGDEHREEGKGKAEWKEDQKLNLCFPSSECSDNKIIQFLIVFRSFLKAHYELPAPKVMGLLWLVFKNTPKRVVMALFWVYS